MPSPPAIHGCVILTKLGKCLAQCTRGTRASDVQTATLCQLVATMQDVGGSLQFGYLELHGLGVVLQQGYHVTIAVLCDPEHGQASARLVAMQALNVFGSNERGTQTRRPPQKPRLPTLRPPCRATTELFHGEIDALAEAHERERPKPPRRARSRGCRRAASRARLTLRPPPRALETTDPLTELPVVETR